MSDSTQPAAPNATSAEGGPEIPDFATLAADPEIAPLLNFDPVVRKVKRPDGWTPELQRELIARIAATGTVQSAVWQMGKHATGAEALYKTPTAKSFRTSWDAAIIIGRRRNGLDAQPPFAGTVPGINRRSPRGRNAEPEPETQPQMDDEQRIDLLERLTAKFMAKIAQERRARLSGEIVAADFYLRQITMIEVSFDLAASQLGYDAGDVLKQIRRRGRGLAEIVDTPFVRYLDSKRRLFWASTPGEPPRPTTFREDFTVDHGDHRTSIDQALGALTAPARGYTREQWAGMSLDEQQRARKRQFDEDAEEQLSWEAEAQADFEARQADNDR